MFVEAEFLLGVVGVFGFGVFGRLVAESLLRDDPDLLPVSSVSDYRESWTGLRRAYFETGAALTHFVKARF